MFGSATLNTAIGLVLLFGITATLCSGFTETLSNLMQLRARYLLTGLRAMLDEPEAYSGTGRAGADNKSTKFRLSTATRDTDKTKEAANSLAKYLTDAKSGDGATEPRPTAAPAAQLAPTAVMSRSELPDDPAPPGTATGTVPTLTLALFHHPAIQALQTRRVGALAIAGRLRNPQYIPARTFSRALVDTLFPEAVASGPVGQGSRLTAIQGEIKKLPDGFPVKKELASLANRAEGDLEGFETSLEKWYDDEMSTIAGWYKRWARVVLGCFGFAVAVLLNLDALQVGHSLYVDGPTQQAVVAEASAGSLCQGTGPGPARQKCVTTELDNLRADGIPLGYPSTCQPLKLKFTDCWAWEPHSKHDYDLLLKLVGWAITAFAVSFGGPFWFDALSKLGNLRSTGTKPSSST